MGFSKVLMACVILAQHSAAGIQWGCEVHIDLGGFSTKTFTNTKQQNFRKAMSDSLGISTSSLLVNYFSDRLGYHIVPKTGNTH